MWKEIKEDPARLSAYNDRVRQIKNEAEKLGVDSQNEKAMADRLAVRLPKKALKSPEFVDTDLDDSDDDQEHIVKKKTKKHQNIQDLLIQTQVLRMKEGLQ